MAHLLGDNWFNVWRWFTHGDPTRTGQISEYDHSTKNLVFCKVQFTYSVPLLILIIVRIMHRRFWHDRTGLQRPCSWPCFINALRITKQRDQEFAIYTENYNNILNLFLLLPSVPFLHEVTGLASCATFKIQVNSSSIKTQYICAMNSIVHVAHTEVRGQIDGPVVAKTKKDMNQLDHAFQTLCLIGSTTSQFS